MIALNSRLATFPIRHQESCASGGTGATPPLAPPGTDDAKGGSKEPYKNKLRNFRVLERMKHLGWIE